MKIKTIKRRLKLTNATLAERLGCSVASVEGYIRAEKMEDTKTAYYMGARSIQRAGLAVRRNFEALIKEARQVTP